MSNEIKMRKVKCRKCHKLLGHAKGKKIGEGRFNVCDGTIQIGGRDRQLVSYCSKKCSKFHKDNWIALEYFLGKNELESYLWRKMTYKSGEEK